MLLAKVFWSTDGNGNWDDTDPVTHVAAHWRDESGVARFPTANDDVFLDRGGGVIINHPAGNHTIRSLHGELSTLALAGGSLTVSADSELGGEFQLSGGELIVGSNAFFTTSGDTTWSGGTARGGNSSSGPGVPLSATGGWNNTGTLALTGTGDRNLAGVMSNRGVIVHTTQGSLGAGLNVGTFINEAEGTYELRTGGSLDVNFTNRGVLRKSVEPGLAAARRDFSNEGGVIDVQSGTFQISVANNAGPRGLNTGGVFQVAAGAMLELASTNTVVGYSGAYTGSGAGKVRLSTGTLRVLGDGATFNFPEGMFEWTGGALQAGPGLNNTDHMTFAIGDTARFNGAINNAGVIRDTAAGNLLFDPVATINNLPGAVYDLQGDRTFQKQFAGSTFFNNSGTFLKSGGFGTASHDAIRFNNQGGTIDVRSGTFALAGGGGGEGVGSSHTGGTFLVSEGAFLDVTGHFAFNRFEMTGVYTGSGAGKVRFLGGTWDLGAAGATFDFPKGMFEWYDGTIDARLGPLANRGEITLPVLGFQTLQGALNNEGVFTLLNDANLLLQGATGVFNNRPSGLFDIHSGATNGGGVVPSGSGGAFNNQGTLRKSDRAEPGNEGATVFTVGSFSNAGKLEVLAGTVQINSAAIAQVSGRTLTGGVWDVADGAKIDLATAPALFANAATVTLRGPGSSFPKFETVVQNTGQITLADGRDWTVARPSFFAGGALRGVAFDPATETLLTYTRFDGQIRRFSPLGVALPSPVPRPGGGAELFDMDVASAPLSIGGTLVPAGTLLVLSNDNFTQRLFAINPVTGAVLATRDMWWGDEIVGVAHDASQGTLYVLERDTDLVREIDPADLTPGVFKRQFPVRPAGSPAFDVNFGDLEIDSENGNVLVVGSGQAVIRELTRTGQWVTDQSLTGLGIGGLSGIALDAATRRLWVASTNGSFDDNGQVIEVTAAFSNRGAVRPWVTRSFNPRSGTLAGVAFDAETETVLIYPELQNEIHCYARDGSEILPRVPRPGASSNEFDLDVVTEKLKVGAVTVPAGALLAVNADTSPQTLYALDKATGSVLSSVALTLPGRAVGGSYHAGEGQKSLFLVEGDTDHIRKVDPVTGAIVSSFPVRPAGSPAFDVNYGDLDVDPGTGHLLVVGSTQAVVRELTPTGEWVRDHDFTPFGLTGMSGIAVDETTGRWWVSNTNGSVYELDPAYAASGTITLGPGSTFTVPGQFHQSSTGVLNLHFGGSPISGQFGQVVSGGAALDGTLGVSLVNGFGPTTGQSFPVMNYASHTGEFSTYTGLKQGKFTLFDVDIEPTRVVLNGLTSTPDLKFDSFDAASFPITAAPGQEVTLKYTVKNLSDIPAEGDWVDSIYLSRDSSLDPSDTLLTRVERAGSLAGSGSYTQTVTAPLPPLADGDYRVIVLTDSRGLVPDAQRNNNTGVSAQSITVTVPTLTLGTPLTESIASGQDLFFKVVVPPGKDLKISTEFGAAPGAEVYLRYGELPNRATFDQSSTKGDEHPIFLVGNSQGGAYYLQLHGREDGFANAFTLLAEIAGFEIVRFTPNKGSKQANDQGTATIRLTGSQFTPQTVITLRNAAGVSRAAQSIRFVDANRLDATFDLRDLPLGAYSVIATDGAKATAALDTFEVIDAPAGLLSVRLMAPRFVRVGSSIGLRIEIDNGNDFEAIAPLLHIQATNVEPGSESRTLFGSGATLPGAIGPLEHRVITQGYRPDPKAEHVVSDFGLSAINPTLTFIDWDAQKESLRPRMIPTDAWDAIWENLKPELGLTLADFYALLQRDARALPGEGINSVERLFQFELQKANNFPAVPPPASAVDAAFPAPGLPLVFGRNFEASIVGRYRAGRLGRGWVDNFDVSISEDDKGLVTLRQGGGNRFFYGDPASGRYFGLPGEFASLTKANGAFHLRETSGEVISFRTDGQLSYLQDTNGNKITAEYTGSQQTSLAHSNGTALTLAYNAQGRIRQITDPAGSVTTYDYDAAGEHLLRVTTTAGVTEYTYTTDEDGPRAHALASISLLDGTHLFFQYDSKGRLARQERDGGAQAVRFTYDAASLSVTDAHDKSTTYIYDDRFRVRATRDPLGRMSQATFDNENNPTNLSVGGGGTANFGFDDRGNPISTASPLGHTQALAYETGHNRLTSFQDALGHATTFSYDANGNLTATTHQDGATEQYSFDAQGNVTRTVNRLGQAIVYTYNSRGQVTRKDLPGSADVDYTYNARGNLETAVNATGTTRLEYLDPQNPDLVTKVIYPTGRFLQYTYTNGRRTQMVDQSGFTTKYLYDAVGRLEFLRDGGDNLIVKYGYDAAGRLERETRGNGTATEYAYDDAGQLLQITRLAPDSSIQSQLAYTYDHLGRRTSMTTADGATSYEYDGAGRLTLVALPTGRIITYAYDAAGNRTVATDNGVATSYTVNELNQYTSVGGNNQTFDAAGNLISTSSAEGNVNYAYDAEGRLISQITPQGTWTYEYDVFGDRIASTLNGVRTQYLVDPFGLGDVVAEYNGTGVLQAHYVHGLGLTSRIDASDQAAYYQFDATGNTTELTGPDGAVINAYSYLPFGEPLSVSETVPNPFEFVGEYGVMREGSGIDYMRNRWYDPRQGRFAQADPIGLAGGTNLYAYVSNDPVSFIDPSGLIKWNEALRMAIETLGNKSASHGDRAFARATIEELDKFAARTAVEATREVATHTFSDGVPTVIRGTRGAGEVGYVALLAALIAGGVAVATHPEIRTTAKDWLLQDDNLLDLSEGLLYGLPANPIGIAKNLLDVLKHVKVEQVNPSIDPNDIVGPGGFGPEQYIVPEGSFPYVVNFQNKPEAQGPAAEVVVTHPLDADLDLDTFELGDLGFGSLTVDVPDGRQFYQTRLDLRSTRGVFVDVTAELDRATRTAMWTLTALDPETLDLPSDPTVGFLPPDKIAPEGQGFATFFVRPKADSPSGTSINAQATIVFDTNAPIDTNVWINTIDREAPMSSVLALNATTSETSFLVAWSGEDGLGSGVAAYDIYVSIDGGAFEVWQDATIATSAVFEGEDGRSYAFYSVAVDHVGHREHAPTQADAATTVVLPSAGFAISPSAGLVTSESGDAATFSVVLASRPAWPVTLPILSANAAEGVAEPSVLVFTPENWNVPQTVTVTGVDDNEADGDAQYQILVGPAVSNDSRYHGLTGTSVAVVNRDNDPSDPTAPTVKRVVVQNGLTQRSYVDQLAIHFSEDVNYESLRDSGLLLQAVTLTNLGMNADVDPDTAVNLALSQFRYEMAADAFVLRWSLDSFAGGRTTLPNGYYLLRLRSDHFSDLAGNALDGDGDGSPEGDFRFYFHRLEGDATGDLLVSQQDMNLVNAALGGRPGSSQWNPNADLDRNGAVTTADRQIVQRALNGRILPPTSLDGEREGMSQTFAAQNMGNPWDVNGNGGVGLDDLLALVGWLREHGSGPVAATGEPPFVDIDGDGACHAHDLLMLVSQLRGLLDASGESEPEGEAGAGLFALPLPSSRRDEHESRDRSLAQPAVGVLLPLPLAVGEHGARVAFPEPEQRSRLTSTPDAKATDFLFGDGSLDDLFISPSKQ